MTNYEIARDIVDSEWKKNANLNPYIIEKKIQEALDQKDSTIQVLREEVERILTEKSEAILDAIRQTDVGSDVIIHNENMSIFCILTVKCKEHPEKMDEDGGRVIKP